MDLTSAKCSIRALFASLNVTDRRLLMEWVQETSVDDILEVSADDDESSGKNIDENCDAQSLLLLESIRQDLQDSLPLDCIFDSETITLPEGSELCGGDASAVQHVDSFVYDEDDLDIACTLGKFSRSYCTECGCRDIKDLEFISHSFSVEQVKYICTQILTNHSEQLLLDIGSRTGALLFGAALLSPLKRSVGVEINKQFADLSSSLISKYNMEDRVTIVNDDILNCLDYVKQAGVVVMNNVFQFFADADKQKRLWRFCLDAIKHKPGTVLITTPAVHRSLSLIDMKYDLSFLQHVSLEQEVESYCSANSKDGFEVDQEMLQNIHVYNIV